MSQTLLFSVGLGVFTITLVATLLYGYLALDRVYQTDVAERPVLDDASPARIHDADPARSAVLTVGPALLD